MNLELAKQKYQDARQLLGLASEEWCESYEIESGRAEICAKDVLTGEVEPIAHLLPACSYDDRRIMTHAPTYMRAMDFLLQYAFNEIRDLRQRLSAQQPKPKQFAAECAMKCVEPAFLKFLEERHGLQRPLTKERAATKVRSILNITSRRELDENQDAATRWRNLVNDFEAWRRHG